MVKEIGAFSQLAEYLKDPLVLSGFVLFIAFLALRQLLAAKIIPNLGRSYGFRILRLSISYGFILGLAIVLLGMGLKYRELSKEEQRRAAAVVANELRENADIVMELEKNNVSISRIAGGLAEILRDKRFEILSGLFPASNIDVSEDEGSLTNLYIERIEWLRDSGLWQNEIQKRRAEEACGAVVRFVGRVRPTAVSLSDFERIRYPVLRQAIDANLGVVRQVSIVNMTDLSRIYREISDARSAYDAIVRRSIDYLDSVMQFCKNLPPDRASLSAALAVERLTFRLIPAYKKRLASVAESIRAHASQLELVAKID